MSIQYSILKHKSRQHLDEHLEQISSEGWLAHGEYRYVAGFFFQAVRKIINGTSAPLPSTHKPRLNQWTYVSLN